MTFLAREQNCQYLFSPTFELRDHNSDEVYTADSPGLGYKSDHMHMIMSE